MCVLFLGSLSQCNILLRWQQNVIQSIIPGHVVHMIDYCSAILTDVEIQSIPLIFNCLLTNG